MEKQYEFQESLEIELKRLYMALEAMLKVCMLEYEPGLKKAQEVIMDRFNCLPNKDEN